MVEIYKENPKFFSVCSIWSWLTVEAASVAENEKSEQGEEDEEGRSLESAGEEEGGGETEEGAGERKKKKRMGFRDRKVRTYILFIAFSVT